MSLTAAFSWRVLRRTHCRLRHVGALTTHTHTPLHSPALAALSPHTCIRVANPPCRTASSATTAAADSATAAAGSDSPSMLAYAALACGAALGVYATYELYTLATAWPPACEQMLALARACTDVRDRMGGEVHASMFWDGTLLPDRVTVRIPVSGASGARGMLYGKAVCVDGKWIVLAAEVHILSRDEGAKRMTIWGPGVEEVYDVLRGTKLSVDDVTDSPFLPKKAGAAPDAPAPVIANAPAPARQS